MSNKYYVVFPNDEKLKGWYEFYAEYVTDVIEYANVQGWANYICSAADKLAFVPSKEKYTNGCLETFCIVKRQDKTYVMRSFRSEQAEITFERSTSDTYGNAFWHLKLEGMHDGEPIYLAVLNVRYDADEYGFSLINEGYFWSDDLNEEVPDDIIDWYDSPLGDALKELYSESYDGGGGYYF